MNQEILYQEQIQNVTLLESEKSMKRDRDLAYLLELDPQKLLFSFYTEAGITGPMNREIASLKLHDGWDNPLSQVRGMFTGHWMSAASRIYQETGNEELRARVNYVVGEIGKCQERNGGGWAFSIPEKYLYGLKKGQHFWASQYVCHKIMMGLLDAYQFADNEEAYRILLGCADWFYEFNQDISREKMDEMMDLEETGGMMELWGDLYAISHDPRHLELMRRYERPHLTEPVLQKIDVLTNMHANITIPEIHGCARAYELTGEERYRKIVENYWDLAVTERGMFATGGQTDGEVWTPKQKQAARLSALNQEHCVVYNMIRLANYLYRWSGDTKYLDYIERNIENGLMAQGFWEAEAQNMAESSLMPREGLVAYFLPLAAGSRKNWGTKFQDFWCCHGTLVQANARYREFVFYQSQDVFTVAQYIPARITTKFHETEVCLEQTEDDVTGDHVVINEISGNIPERPDYCQMRYRITAKHPVRHRIQFRIPWWQKGEMEIWINGEKADYEKKQGYALIEREWQEDEIQVRMPYGLICWPLPDEPQTVAFLAGPVVLAGIVPEERMLRGDIAHPETMIRPHHERQWSSWTSQYKTVNQERGFYLKPLKDIGNQSYTVYFPVKER
ncbi:MAG: beta-L-arabinofuranosidase domain-containing protein [Dorea sp.]